MSLTEVENLLAARLGFDIHTVGPHAVGAVVRKSMKEAGFTDSEAFARMLVSDEDAWNHLVDRVVIPETWFFRDAAPFELTANLAHTHMRFASDRVLRILSCPCSSGEEPYSLVMSLLHAGAPAESFTVDAVDVSRRALESAQSAVFRARSFRDETRWYRAPYFDHDEGNGFWRLKSSVASLVRFQQGNLIRPDFLENETPYDLVFCRNLLIYLHSAAKLLAIASLRRLVAENGVLVVGHAEAAFAREHGFTPTGSASAFAFVKRRGDPAGPKVLSTNRQSAPASTPGRPKSVVPPRPATATAAPVITAALASHDSELPMLNSARELGDAGQLHEAVRECTRYLQIVPDSEEGHFLLGVLNDALGQVELAMGCFKKVLYLNPNHREALLHLALKKEALGDSSAAELLRARARRAEDVSTVE